MVENREPYEKVVPVFIYEDQDGSLKYPKFEFINKAIEKERDHIVRLFEEKITLLLIKKNEVLDIYCHILASRQEGREEGFYIVYKTIYSDRFFENFKDYGETALNSIELEFRDNEENLVFKNISSFDIFNKNSNNTQFQNNFPFDELEVEALRQALTNKERLTYIGEVSSALSHFTKNVLNNIPDFSMCISPEKKKLFGINIQNKLNVTELLCTEDTQKILNEYRKKLKIESVKQNIKESISQLKSCNLSEFEVDNYLFKNCSSLSPSKYNNSDFTRNLFRLLENADYEYMLDWRIIYEKLIKQPIYPHLVNSQIGKSEDLPEPLTFSSTPEKSRFRKRFRLGLISDLIYFLKPAYFLIILAILLIFFVIFLIFYYNIFNIFGNSTALL